MLMREHKLSLMIYATSGFDIVKYLWSIHTHSKFVSLSMYYILYMKTCTLTLQ